MLHLRSSPVPLLYAPPHAASYLRKPGNLSLKEVSQSFSLSALVLTEQAELRDGLLRSAKPGPYREWLVDQLGACLPCLLQEDSVHLTHPQAHSPVHHTGPGPALLGRVECSHRVIA